MTTTRRGFLGAILAAGMAPAIVKAEILMPCRRIILPAYMTGEIGRIEGIRFITSDSIKQIKQDLEQRAVQPIAGEFIVFAHSDWNAELKTMTSAQWDSLKFSDL